MPSTFSNGTVVSDIISISHFFLSSVVAVCVWDVLMARDATQEESKRQEISWHVDTDSRLGCTLQCERERVNGCWLVRFKSCEHVRGGHVERKKCYILMATTSSSSFRTPSSSSSCASSSPSTVSMSLKTERYPTRSRYSSGSFASSHLMNLYM